MQLYKSVFVIISGFLLAVCFGEISIESKEKFLNGFVEYLNNLPDQVYMYDEGVLLNAQKTDDDNGCYHIEVRLRANAIHNVDSSGYLKCSATIQDLEENGITIQDNKYHCEDDNQVTQTSVADGDTLEDLVVVEQTTTAAIHQPVRLDNEVQSNIGVTSGEEFVAVPRLQFGGTCTGCASHVNPEAPGVSELAALGIKQLNRHESNTKHLLEAVLDVERQVQVVNGVRYTLTLQVGFDNCTSTSSDPCFESKVCRISILEKTWIKMPDGSKYRAILSNNCSQEWIFGDEGEYIPNNESNDVNINPPINIQDKADDTPKPIPDYDKIVNIGSADNILKVIHNTDLQVQIKTEKSLTEKELKDLEEQVIPYDNHKVTSANIKFHHVSEFQTRKQDAVQYKQPEYRKSDDFLNEDRKKAIDDLLSFFNSAGFDNIRDTFPRIKRSYERELKVMSVAEKIHKIKKNINKAKYLYSLAQNMVDYLNEMDLEIKTRVLLDVIAAEEEFENYQNFFYIQARVVVPCDKANCEGNDTQNKICNGVIETTDEERPQILSAFCYDEQKKKLKHGKTETVELNDPVLLKLTKESLKKIELESKYTNAMKIDKILQAYTRRVSGTVTQITVSLLFTDCNKTVPYMKRTNCTTVQSMDSNVCEITVHERYWHKEKKITYSCDQRPIDERFSNKKNIHDVEETIKDKKVLDMTQEALQYLEMNSNKNNKQKIVHINSVTTQLIAGLLTEIKFIVGYTTCSYDSEVDLNSCELLDNQPLRNCKAQVWDRPWLEDGRQINVNCDDSIKIDNLITRRKLSQHLHFVGGLQTKDPNEFESLAKESLQHYLISNNVKEIYEVVKVENVTVQLVAGTLTSIVFKVAPKNSKDKEIHCSAKVWDRPWLNTKEFINVMCDKIEDKLVHKRHVLGGKLDKDPNDPQYKQLAQESLKKFLLDTGSTQHHKILEVKKVTTKVVSGSITEIDFTISPTNCELGNNNEPTTSDCVVLDSSNIISCHSEIWEQKWLNKKDINVSCDISSAKERNKRQLPGGKKKQNVNESQYQLMAEESLKKFLLDTGSTQHHEILEVKKVTTKVVSGSITEIDFTISPTNCELGNNNEPTTSDCVVLDSSNIISCHSEIWEQKWLNKKDINVSCDISSAKKRNKRQLPGGKKEQNVNESHYQLMAEESLKKFLLDTGSTQHHEILEVKKVTTKVVSGSITEIDFTISPTNCELGNNNEPTTSDCVVLDSSNIISCHSEIWEQKWLNKKDINVSCDISSAKKRNKRQLPGGKKELNVNESHYQLMAEESLKKFLLDTGSTQHHEILEVKKVTTKVVSGIITEIDFTITPTNCELGNNNEPTTSDCVVLDSSNIINCHSEVWEQPWLTKRDVTVKCSSKKHIPNIDPNPKKVKYIIEKENTQEYSKNETDGTYLGTGKNNKRRKRSLKGKKEKQDPNLAEFKLLAQESLQKYQKSQSNKSANHVVTKVVQVVRQQVSGIKFTIDFIAKPIECTQGDTQKKLECKHSENDGLYCHSTIWKRPWKGRNKIDVDCDRDVSEEDSEDYREKRNVSFGALKEKDINNKNYKSLAEQALAKYQRLSNVKNIHRIIKIHRVTEQVVAGIVIQIEYSISPTECLIEDSPIYYIDDCNILTPKTELLCQAKIWDRPWITSDKNITIKCKEQNSKKSKSREKKAGDNKHRNKRQVAPIEDDIDEDVMYYYADRALSYINDKTDTNNIQKLVTIHAIQNSMNMGVNMVRMYIETAFTYCIRHQDDVELAHCEELTGMYHRLCYVRLWPSPDDELVIQSIAVVCDDEPDFKSITGISKLDLIRASLKDIEASPKLKYKVIHQGEPNLIPSLDSSIPFVLSFVTITTNCSKYIDISENPFSCFVDTNRIPRSCTSSIWMVPNSKKIKKIKTSCRPDKPYRSKRSISLESTNVTTDEKTIQNFVKESLEKLEMSSLHKYKQRVLQINSFNTKITKGRLTTIDFDVGYTSCLKYEWVENVTQCEFIEHLPRRHCVSQIRERLWLNNGKQIDVNCEDDETPLEATIEFESAENAMQLAKEVLKHIEAKYPHPRKQKVVRIFSLDKQEIAGVHYRMKMEVGYTDCLALSIKDDCKLVNDVALNKFCRANVWLRPWTEHPPTYRVSCDYQDGITTDIYHKIQAQHLFSDFLTTYTPDYIDDHIEMLKRFDIFQNNVRKIHEFNTQERGTARYAVTRFSDLTYEEFGQKYLGLKPNLRDNNQIPIRKADIPQVHLPNAFDWRQYDAVTEVKDQGACGSCWAFSVTGNIEGQWKMQSGELVSLSEQELVDCDSLDQGCNGGLPDNAYRAIEQLGGLEAENDYPYEGENDKCAFNKTLSRVQISGAVNISSNETDMAKWLVQNGPISIGINANAMQFYVGGVSHPWRMLCSPSNLDHGVLIVGYGVKDYPLFHKRLPYWIIKNSWGKRWGEQGYYRVYRGDGTCGVNQMASSAVI